MFLYIIYTNEIKFKLKMFEPLKFDCIYIKLPVKTITYLMITNNILILLLKISGKLLTIGTKGKKKRTCFEKDTYILYSLSA